MAQKCLWPWRADYQVWDPSRLPAPEWAGETLGAFPHPSIPEGPSPLSSLLLPPFCAPRTHMTREALEGRGPHTESQKNPNRIGGGNPLSAFLYPPVLEGPFLPLCFSSFPLLLPPSHASRTQVAGGCPGEWRTRLWSPAGFLGLE